MWFNVIHSTHKHQKIYGPKFIQNVDSWIKNVFSEQYICWTYAILTYILLEEKYYLDVIRLWPSNMLYGGACACDKMQYLLTRQVSRYCLLTWHVNMDQVCATCLTDSRNPCHWSLEFPDSLSSLLWLTQHKREHPARLQTDPDNWVDCVSTPSHVESETPPQCRPSVEDAGPALRQRFHTWLTQPEGCVSYLGSPGGTVRAADRAVFPEAFWISGAGGSESDEHALDLIAECPVPSSFLAHLS